MMEDWTDIIGEELENFEEPLPADDWMVLQQKYELARRKKRLAAFAWTGGFTSVAAVLALVLLLFRPDSAPVHDEIVADVLPPLMEQMPADTLEEVILDEVILDEVTPLPLQPAVGIRKFSDKLLVAEGESDDETPTVEEEIKKLLADASPEKEEESDGSLRFEDLPEERPARRRGRISVGMSGSISGTPIIGMVADAGPGYADPVPPGGDLTSPPTDSLFQETQTRAAVQMRGKQAYTDTYRHELPVSFGVSARYFLSDMLTVNTGLYYTKYSSTRTRYYTASAKSRSDRQYAHYLGIPVRCDWMIVNRKHFNFYVGAGVQVDKCIYATVGDEKLREKQFLVNVSGVMGVQVNIVPTVGLYFEPDLSYNLNEGTLKTFRSREELMLTARAGLRFSF